MYGLSQLKLRARVEGDTGACFSALTQPTIAQGEPMRLRFKLPTLFPPCLLVLLAVLASQGQTTPGRPALGQPTTEPTVPRLVRFTGMARDLNGKPISGIVGVTFSLYAEQTGGTALWMETQNAQADSNGHYSVLLGSTKPDGLPAELFASEQARWIGVQIEQA